MSAPLIEFPADDPDRARRFWHGVLGVTLAPRPAVAGSGWQTDTDDLRLGVHERGPGPGDTASLPYFTVADLAAALERVRELGGSIIHPGDRWAVCRDSEGSPFALRRACTQCVRTRTIAARAERSYAAAALRQGRWSSEDSPFCCQTKDACGCSPRCPMSW